MTPVLGDELEHLAWPPERLGEALAALARAARLIGAEATPPAVAAGVLERGGAAVDAWLDSAAAALGVEVEPVTAPFGELADVVRRAAPALIRLSGGGVLALAGAGRAHVDLIGPDDARARRPLAAVLARLAAALPGDPLASASRLVGRAGLSGARRLRAQAVLLGQLLGSRHVGGVTLVRPLPGASFAGALRASGALRAAALFVAAQVGLSAAVIAGWWLLGRGALGGRLDRGWLAAWALLLVGAAMLRVVGVAAQGRAALRAGAVLRTRLIAGALRLDADSVRQDGVGHHLGRVLDADAVESLALGGASSTFSGVLDLAVTPFVFAAGAGGGALLAVFAVFAVLAVVQAAAYFARRRRHIGAGLRVTHELVERLVGHRTRLIQEPRGRWHEGIDHVLSVYVDAGRRVDKAATGLSVLLPRAWLVAGLVAVAPAFVGGAPLAALAVAVGGLLLGQRGLRSLGDGLAQLAGAAVAWRQVAPLFRAAAAGPQPGAPALALLDPRARPPLIEARDVAFRHRGRAEPVLDGLDLSVAPGERLLLEGPSGGGKSTLAALLAALRAPTRGLVLLGGLDRASLGDDGWRRHVVNAPQFHDNHIFAETMLFNVLLGRGWPASTADVAEAEAVCRELGLGPLLDRMPAGLQQMVGDMGWQLSHGERSRVFIARALLSRAELLILDESFAALDPETLRHSLAVVERRAGTLMVIAHP